jgi:hypothetical protein
MLLSCYSESNIGPHQAAVLLLPGFTAEGTSHSSINPYIWVVHLCTNIASMFKIIIIYKDDFSIDFKLKLTEFKIHTVHPHLIPDTL